MLENESIDEMLNALLKSLTGYLPWVI